MKVIHNLIWIIILSLSLFLIGCNAQKRASKRLDKIANNFPELLMTKCAISYVKPSIKIIERDTITKDSIVIKNNYVNCDSVVSDTSSSNNIIAVPCAEKYYFETIIDKQIDSFERLDRLHYWQGKYEEELGLRIAAEVRQKVSEQKNDKLSHQNFRLKLSIGIGGLLVILAAILKFKFL